jgi:hypothetical protein
LAILVAYVLPGNEPQALRAFRDLIRAQIKA